MHVVFRESHGLEETETPFDPGQTPADLVVLSFSDSDLGAFAAGWHRMAGQGPSLRLQNLVALKHPLSVDTYAEAVLARAKGILIRLIGGESYWAYGLATVQDLARRHRIALAVLPADGREDGRLDALSTLPVSTLRRLQALCDAGGAVAAQAALQQLALAAGLYAGPVAGEKTVPDWGWYDPARGVVPAPAPAQAGVVVTFYRSYLTAADTGPVDALIEAFRARGIPAHGLFAATLKGAAPVAEALRAAAPRAVVNATAFSARGEDGTSPLDAPGCPVFQVALSTARRRDWAEAARGLSPADLAMHVVLPEVDGRLFAGVASFKSPGKRDPELEFTRFAHRAEPGRIAAVVDRVAAWLRLAETPAAEKRVALVLSTYPGQGWNLAHAVGLDALASAEAILARLAEEGFAIPAGAGSAAAPSTAPPTPIPSPRGGGEAPDTARDPAAGQAHRTALVPPSPPVGEGWGGGASPDAIRDFAVAAAPAALAPSDADGALPDPLSPPPSPSSHAGGERRSPADSTGTGADPRPSAPPSPLVGEGWDGGALPDAIRDFTVAAAPAALSPSDADGALPDPLSPPPSPYPQGGGERRNPADGTGTGANQQPLAPPSPPVGEGGGGGAMPDAFRSAPVALASGTPALPCAWAPQADPQAPGPSDGLGAGAGLARRLATETLAWPLAAYRTALATLPQSLRDDLQAAWGAPEDDPAVAHGAFRFPALRLGLALVALQPERGEAATRDLSYHDLSRTPRHAYVAFHLWLRGEGLHALIHVGAHGTLEWLPGKAVALSETCWPEALLGPLPVLYPFIVNDPGEAAQAKRRLGAVTLGHLPPPLVASETPETLRTLERLLDEYATADGLDPGRRRRLIAAIRDEAAASGIADDLGLPPDASPAEAIPRIDRFVCDLKDSRFGRGLHIYGRAEGEMEGLIAGLSGRRVPAGPAGSPHRGRADVLPTGRNLFSVDPRAVPTQSAHAQGIRLAEELLRRHLQDQGDWPRSLVVDLWGSATIRTAGEEFAMALHLAGLAPQWDAATGRVTGFEIVPLALLGRPRIDVTLRISGLFRDTFPGLGQLFEAGAAALAARDEAAEDNPYRAASPRVFGPRPGLYGTGMDHTDYSDAGRQAAGEAWLTGSEWTFDAKGEARQDRPALEARVLAADGFAHVQDLAETDLLVAADYAAQEGGFAAALAALGGAPRPAWHLDATSPGAPRARSLPEEIARVVRARAANPAWATGMMEHGFRGGAEIAATLEHLAAFAHLTRAVPGHLFDLYHEATLGRADLVDFLRARNPGALAAMEARFAALAEAGLWTTRSNSRAMGLA